MAEFFVTRVGAPKGGYAWSKKDIKDERTSHRDDPVPPRPAGPRPGFLVIEAPEELEAHLPHEMSDEAIRSMDEHAKANRGKPSSGSIRKL